MFEKYKIYKYAAWYGVSKKYLLFFWRRLYNNESAINPTTGETISACSNVLLLFKTAAEAEMEIDHIGYGGELISRTFRNGKLFSPRREYHEKAVAKMRKAGKL
jgi:hypothetical protein